MRNKGQAGLILIMIMAVVGAVSVGLASRAVENLRTQEIENISSQAFRAADAGLELALSTKANVPQTQLGSSNLTYTATYNTIGSDGFVSDAVAEGDVVQIDLAGASAGLTGLTIYWNANAAVKVSLFFGNAATGSYAVTYWAYDPSAANRILNKFSVPTGGSYTFKTVSYNNKVTIPINLGANPPPKLVRVVVLYQGSSVGVEPVGGTLASGQVVSVTAKGTAENNITSNVSFTKFSQRVPTIFENVLYTNSSLSQ